MKPIYFVNLISSISSNNRVIYNHEKALKKREFYEEPIGEDSIYPDY